MALKKCSLKIEAVVVGGDQLRTSIKINNLWNEIDVGMEVPKYKRKR